MSPEVSDTAAVSIRYTFRFEMVDPNGVVVSAEPLPRSVFERAIRATYFDAFRRGRLAEYAPRSEAAQIEPRYTAAEPNGRACGFTVTVPTADDAEHACPFGLGYFRTRARRKKATLVREGRLADDATPHYQLSAYGDEPDAPAVVNESALSVESLVTSLPVTTVDESPPRGEPWDAPVEAALRVVFPRSVLGESVEEARRTPDHETGGLLVGRLVRDPTGAIALQITCLISGEGTTDATATSVTFTPATFARAREIAALRDAAGGERIVGWYHSHPFRFCDACPLPTPPECVAKVLFYSEQDVCVMESTFDQPYMVGLLAAVEARLETTLGRLPVRLYGWHAGELVERGFEVSND